MWIQIETKIYVLSYWKYLIQKSSISKNNNSDKKDNGIVDKLISNHLRFTDPFPVDHPLRKFVDDGQNVSEYVTAPYQRKFPSY